MSMCLFGDYEGNKSINWWNYIQTFVIRWAAHLVSIQCFYYNCKLTCLTVRHTLHLGAQITGRNQGDFAYGSSQGSAHEMSEGAMAAAGVATRDVQRPMGQFRSFPRLQCQAPKRLEQARGSSFACCAAQLVPEDTPPRRSPAFPGFSKLRARAKAPIRKRATGTPTPPSSRGRNSRNCYCHRITNINTPL